MKKSDHDLLIEIRNEIKHIVQSIKTNRADINGLKKTSQCLKDWQEDAETKVKIYTAVAIFIGGVVMFIVDKVWDLFTKK